MAILDGIHTLDELKLENQRAFLRLDLDVPVENGKLVRDDRLRAALPTIQHALKAGARVVLAARLGDPGGRVVPSLSLLPIAERLSELLATEVYLPDDSVGDAARKVVQDLRAGHICLLENLGFHEEEASNDEGFARKLARFADVFINDSLRDSNRSVASLDALPRLVRERGMGAALAGELTALSRIYEKPERPLVLVVGGDNAAEKLDFIQAWLPRVDAILVGGTLGNTLLAARGTDLGASMVDRSLLARGRALLSAARDGDVELLLPVDLVVTEDEAAPAGRVVAVGPLGKGTFAMDIGPKTAETYAARTKRAKMLLWNGPLGLTKNPAFAQGTLSFAQGIAEGLPFRVLVGDDTQAALQHADEELTNKIGFVSASGRAGLELIEGRRLPGLEALRGGAT
jgi:phosphoglycerate kinase